MHASRFDDFDAFAASVRDADHEMMVHDVVRPEWSIRHVTIDGVHVQAGREGAGNITEGRVRDGGHFLFFPVDRPETYVANGTPLDEDTAFLLDPAAEFCLRSPVEHEWCTIFLPDERFGRVLREEGALRRISSTTSRVVRPGRAAIGRLISVTMDALAVAERGEEVEDGIAAECLADRLVRACRAVVEPALFDDAPPRPGRPTLPREQIMSRVLAFVEAHPDRALRVGELATVAGVSERTLRAVFQARFGISPVRYLHLRQLHQVNRALRRAVPGTATVSEVVRRFGVWEQSRFARRYREQFGELPSETLRADLTG